MNEILQANVFFVIASIGTVVFIVLLSVALYHVIKVIRSIRRIVERIEAGSETVAEDLRELRASLSPTRVLSFLAGLTGLGPARRSRRVADDDE
jgi:hypothetical protein